jgi:hypothetical protein
LRDFEIVGDRTGRAWRYNLSVDNIESAGLRYRARAVDGGSSVVLHRCEKVDRSELVCVRTAIDVALRPQIAAEPTIRQLIDLHDVPPQLDWVYEGDLYTMWEWADMSLADAFRSSPRDGHTLAEQIEESVGQALAALHGIGLGHLDVTPDNILCVEGFWKLADLDICAELGSVVSAGPKDRRWRHPARSESGATANDEWDEYGLDAVLNWLRSRT